MKVGEVGLAAAAGAELMPLDTTEDAGTWRARKSAPGLVGSSVGEGEEGGREGRKEPGEERRGEEVLREKKGRIKEEGELSELRGQKWRRKEGF